MSDEVFPGNYIRRDLSWGSGSRAMMNLGIFSGSNIAAGLGSPSAVGSCWTSVWMDDGWLDIKMDVGSGSVSLMVPPILESLTSPESPEFPLNFLLPSPLPQSACSSALPSLGPLSPSTDPQSVPPCCTNRPQIFQSPALPRRADPLSATSF